MNAREWRDPSEPRMAALDTNLRVLRREMAALRSYSTLGSLATSRAQDIVARMPQGGTALRLLKRLRTMRRPADRQRSH